MKLQFASHPLYGISQLVFAALVITWVIAYYNANSQWDDCHATTQARLTALQARIAKTRTRQDELKTRGAALAKAIAEKAKQGN